MALSNNRFNGRSAICFFKCLDSRQAPLAAELVVERAENILATGVDADQISRTNPASTRTSRHQFPSLNHITAAPLEVAPAEVVVIPLSRTHTETDS